MKFYTAWQQIDRVNNAYFAVVKFASKQLGHFAVILWNCRMYLCDSTCFVYVSFESIQLEAT